MKKTTTHFRMWSSLPYNLFARVAKTKSLQKNEVAAMCLHIRQLPCFFVTVLFGRAPRQPCNILDITRLRDLCLRYSRKIPRTYDISRMPRFFATRAKMPRSLATRAKVPRFLATRAIKFFYTPLLTNLTT